MPDAYSISLFFFRSFQDYFSLLHERGVRFLVNAALASGPVPLWVFVLPMAFGFCLRMPCMPKPVKEDPLCNYAGGPP